MDLVHYYLIVHTQPEAHDELNRALAGPAQMTRSETVQKILPPPPTWNRIPAAGLEHLARLRAQQAAPTG